MKSGTTERGSDDVAMGNGTKREDVESERGPMTMRNGAREREDVESERGTMAMRNGARERGCGERERGAVTMRNGTTEGRESPIRKGEN